MKQFAQSLAVAIIGAIIAILLTYIIIDNIESRNIKELDATRAELHGFWIFRIRINESDLEQYKEIELFNFASLTIDKNFEVNGVSYKWREINKTSQFIYPRERRTVSDIRGSIIGRDLILNARSRNEENLESITVFDGSIISEGLIQGNLLSDVAFSIGTFCAKRIETTDVFNENISCELP